MSADDGILAQVVAALSRALSPLVAATASPEALGALLARLGWTTAPGVEVVAAIASVATDVQRLAQHVENDASTATLGSDVVSAIRTIAALAGTDTGSMAAPFDHRAFWSALPGDLIALLLCDDLKVNAPGFYGLLSFIGVVRIEARVADPATSREAYDARVLDWTALGRTIASPSSLLADVYGWGARFDHSQFLTALADLAGGLGVTSSRFSPPDPLVDRYAASDNPDRGTIELLSLSPIVMESPTLDAMVKPALLVLPLAPKGHLSSPPEGVLLRPMVTGTAAATVDLGPAAILSLTGDFQATPLRIQLRPGGTVVEDASSALHMSARVNLTPAAPVILAGTAAGSRFEVTRAHLGLEADGSSVTIDAGLDEATAVLNLVSADSFLRGILGDGEAALAVSGLLTWSSASGLRFSGNALPSITIPTNLRIANVVIVTEIEVEAAPAAPGGVQITVAIDGSFALGPLALIVEGFGLALKMIPATLDEPGNFALADLSLGLKPPTGFGLSVDLEGIITGGGFLSIDGHRYAGIASLKMLGIGLTVAGIVETELPGNPDGWSVFLCVMADFTPVPLGFGFFLSGVGGFMGLHRTLDELALADGVRDGRIDSLLFPEDPLADATRILADIDAYFPTLQDTHAFGAMARIDWGVPALFSGEIGVVLVVPDFRIAVVGDIASVLPSADVPLIELHMGVVGYIDPAEATFWVTASIYDSRLVAYALSGDMAMYVSLGEEPYFLLAVGGYHPHWKPPSCVPSSMRGLRRMTAGIDLGEDLQVGLDAYLAITSGTLQFGAEVFAIARARELGVEFTAEGSFGFDVLVIFVPFSIVATMSASISIAVAGQPLLSAKVTLRLEGPEPWFGRATATFAYLGVPVTFHVAIGGRVANDAPDAIPLWDELERALHDVKSWSAPAIAASVVPAIALRALDPVAEAGLWLEPDGALELRQRVLPLNRTIETYGAYVPAGESRFNVAAAGLATGKTSDWNELEDWFAPAQFTEMTSDERLSAPSFEEMDAGVTLSSAGFTVPRKDADLATTDLAYAELVLEDKTQRLGTRALSAARYGLGLRAPRLLKVQTASRRTVGNITTMRVSSQRYVVADALDATAIGPGAQQTFADAIVSRRTSIGSTDSRARIIPTQSKNEEAA